MAETDPQVRNRSRARVVVADDHSRIRQAIEEVLSSPFDVVAAVADGRQAVDAAHRLDPDVVVLDITMPVLDGFEAARELVRCGSRAKIVFLTAHASDEYVAAAVDAGVDGHVEKSRLSRDLEEAITHVLAGRLRVPSASSLLGIADARARHAVQFYANEDARIDELSRFAAQALRRGNVAAVVGRPAMLDRVASRLTDARFDLASLAARGRYQAFDAEECLSNAMRGDEPDEASLVEFMGKLEHARVTCAEGTSKELVAFGEIAPLLLRDGNMRGALALERMWHSRATRFHTLCSYCCFDLDAHGGRDAFRQLYAVHGTVSA
jgi:DNA-binding NarL/FixJ family response regulator